MVWRFCASFELEATLLAGTATGLRNSARPRYTAPRAFGSSPDHGLPLEKNLVCASSCSIGWVNRITTTTSMIVVRPSVYAKPFTLPTARMKSTTAASRLTAFEARIVRKARFQPASTAPTSGRPSRSSSRTRSK